ncbi:MAG: H+transporting two-sector ATPase subunit [Myxococcales bacterium]|nr:H+transporting two-sector ATPase subunit [Myxococcales bacterium]
MSTPKKILTILAMPAAFVTAFVLAFLLMGAADAFAQPAAEEAPTPTETGSAGEMPAYGHAPPSDDVPPTEADAEKARVGKEAAGDDIKAEGPGTSPAGEHGDGHAAAGHDDPSKHFNFFNFSYRGKDVFGGKFGDSRMVDPHTGEVVRDSHGRIAEEEPMSAPFIFMILNFAILMGLLIWKGGPAASQIAADRHDQIKTALDEAAKLRKMAEDKLREYETRVKDADVEIKKLVDGIRTDAEADKVRILDNAAKQAAAMKRDAELRIAAEIEAARAVLTREVTAAASIATEKLLREKMMPVDQQKLVGAFIQDIKSEQSMSAKERS